MKYSCGVDIVLNSRFNSYDDTKAKYFLTDKEFEEYLKKENSYKPFYLAGRWAAKEAIFKAISNNIKILVKDIEVLNNKNGKPICTNINNVSISISHEREYAIAFAIYENNADQ